MRILFREPMNQPLKLKVIKRDYKQINELIGGYHTIAPIGKGVVCLLDEEGLLKGLQNNFYHDRYGWIVGNVVFVGFEGDDYTSLTDTQIEYVARYIGFPVEE